MSIEQSYPVIRDLIYGAVTYGSAAIAMADLLEKEIRMFLRRGHFRNGKSTVYPEMGVELGYISPAKTLYDLPDGTPTILATDTCPVSLSTQFAYREVTSPILGSNETYDWFMVRYNHVTYFGMKDSHDTLRWGDVVDTVRYLKQHPESDMVYATRGFFFDPREVIFKSTPGVAVTKP